MSRTKRTAELRATRVKAALKGCATATLGRSCATASLVCATVCLVCATAIVDSTRKTDWFALSFARSLIPNSELVERGLRTAGPLVDEDVAHVLQVRNAHLARPESARGEIPETAEERDRVTQTAIRIRRVRDLIEQLTALRVGDVDEPLAEAILRQSIDEREP